MESRQRITPFVVSLALFMEAVDTTILNTAIPAMAESLAVNPVNLKIALISYLVSLAVFIPISGWAADKFGIKRVFMAAIFLFTLSSLWCGFAHNLPTLVIARTLQGLGGAFMLPVGRLILIRRYPRQEFIKTMNRIVMIAALGMMLGPVFGGFITHTFSWHWIFWVNIPAGLLAIMMAAYGLEDVKPQPVHALDKAGFILFGLGLAALTFGLSAFSETNVHESVAISVIAAAILLLIGYRAHSRGRHYPIVNATLFRSRTFRVSILGNLFSRLGFGGVPFILPLMLQIGLGFSASMSGLLLAPIALGVFMIKLFILPLLALLGYKRLLLLNTALVAIALCLFATINANTSIISIACYTFIFGFLISLQFSSVNSLAYSELSPEHLSAATSITSTTQQLSQSFGVAAGALFIRLFSPGTASLSLSMPIFHHVFIAMSALTLLSLLIFMQLKPQDGAQMIGKTPLPN